MDRIIVMMLLLLKYIKVLMFVFFKKNYVINDIRDFIVVIVDNSELIKSYCC